MDIMVTLLEAKLNSLPEDIINTISNPIILNEIKQVNNLDNVNNKNENENKEIKEDNNVKVIEETKSEEPEVIKEDTPEQSLKKFIDSYDGEIRQGIDTCHKMLKFGIPFPAVLQKAQFNQFDIKTIEVNYIYINFRF